MACLLILVSITACQDNNMPSSNTNNKSETNTFFTDTGSYSGANYIYSAAMTLAWNELKDEIIKEEVKLKTNDPKALDLIDKFNQAAFTKSDMDEASYYIKSGFGPETLDLINKESKEKFPDKSFANLDIPVNPEDFIAYAYFLKKVDYSLPFTEYNLLKFEGTRVKGFRGEGIEQKQNVKVLEYRNDDEFIIKLDLQDESDELFLAKGQAFLGIDFRATESVDAADASDNNHVTPGHQRHRGFVPQAVYFFINGRFLGDI